MNEEQWLNALVKAGHDPDVAKAAAKVFSDTKAEAGDVEKAFKSLKGGEEEVTEKSAAEPATDDVVYKSVETGATYTNLTTKRWLHWRNRTTS